MEKKIVRIYTEDNDNLPVLVSEFFDGFTILHAIGVYKGTMESAAIIEIIVEGEEMLRVKPLASYIARKNNQTEVIVTEHPTFIISLDGIDYERGLLEEREAKAVAQREIPAFTLEKPPQSYSDLRRLAEKQGGKVVQESSGRWTVYQVEAPEGKVWVDGWTHALRVEWIAGVSEHRKAALKDAFERMKSGLADDEETGGGVALFLKGGK